MFEKRTTDAAITDGLEQRKTILKSPVQIPLTDEFYLSFISKYQTTEMTPDIQVFGYEDALKENAYVGATNADVNRLTWMIGRTGQGDEWFIRIADSSIVFYDHNHGDYNGEFIALDINFREFLQMACLFRELETQLDETENLTVEQSEAFKAAINSIHPGLYDVYPFNYF